MKCIIDTDPGADDVLALIMALNSPELEILALTTVEGNARLEHTTANALRLLAYMGQSDIPVYEGESMPLEGEFHHAYEVHGTDGLTVRLPDTEVVPADGNAVDFIIETALASPGEGNAVRAGALDECGKGADSGGAAEGCFEAGVCDGRYGRFFGECYSIRGVQHL